MKKPGTLGTTHRARLTTMNDQTHKLDEFRSKRALSTNAWCGLFFRQVCAVDDATDEEILAAANASERLKRERLMETDPDFAGYYGDITDYKFVIRDAEKQGINKEGNPGPCLDIPGRTHFIVG